MQKALTILLGIIIISCSQEKVDFSFDGNWLLLTPNGAQKMVATIKDNLVVNLNYISVYSENIYNSFGC